MKHNNIEIKARCSNIGKIRSLLKSLNADYKGIDHQIDTYFKVNNGRLKLRQGNIENHLIYYERNDQKGPKQSKVLLIDNKPEFSLKEMLSKSLGVLVVVDKKREIYFIKNVKFHLDTVNKLGKFVEIEAIEVNGTIGNEKLLAQCKKYMELLNITDKNLIKNSYSDLLLREISD